MRRLIPVVILAIAVVAVGQSRLFPESGDTAAANSGQTPAATPPPETPHSPAAIDARRKYDLSVKLAREAYRKALVAADKDYIDALAGAEDTAMKEGLSEKPEADRLDAARLAMVDEMKRDEKANPVDASTDKTFISASYGSGNHWVDVTQGVMDRLSKKQDLWVDSNITDGRGGSGDLKISLKANEAVVIVCRASSRIFISKASDQNSK